MRRRFWEGRRVFITGHTGFKGGWASLWLQELGAKVAGLALPPAMRPSFFEACKVDAGMESVMGDIRDKNALTNFLRAFAPEIVIHMAAQPLVRRSYVDPVETFETNVLGTVNVLEAVRGTESVRAAVVVTSDKCYENREWVWGYRENEPMGGYDPYSASKGCAELVTSSYRNSFFSKPDAQALVASVRAGNVIGGGDWAEDRLVPDLMRSIEKRIPALIRNPHAVRPWQHVLEPVRGYLDVAQALIEKGTPFAQAWNFGPAAEDTKPVHWIADRLTRTWGSGASWTTDSAPAPHEANFLRLDCTKANTKLGWWPRWNLSTALDRTVEWHQAFQTGRDMRVFSLEQIAQYENQ